MINKYFNNNSTEKDILDEIIDFFRGAFCAYDNKSIDVIEEEKKSGNEYKKDNFYVDDRNCFVFRDNHPESAKEINIYDDGKHGKHGKHENIEMDSSGGVRI
jgi:hypothetical protein